MTKWLWPQRNIQIIITFFFLIIVITQVLLLLITIQPASSRRLYPIVLLAGYMGNQLHYRLDNADMPAGCVKDTPRFKPLWMDSFAATFKPKCWYQAMKLKYNWKRKHSYAPRGVLVYPWRFGRTAGSEYIAPPPFQENRMTLYFQYLVNMLEQSAGYVRNKNIVSAAYDWRRAPQMTYRRNGNTPVVLLGHSMGGNFAYVFLRRMSRPWKRKYVKTLFSLATPWGGNFKYMYSYLYTDDFSGNTLPVFRQVERGYSALSFLLPNQRIFGHETLISTPTFNFTPSTMYEYFRRLGNAQAYLQWIDTRHTMEPFKHPEVDIVCIGGRGFNTMRKMVLTNDQSFYGGKKGAKQEKKKKNKKRKPKPFPPPHPTDPMFHRHAILYQGHRPTLHLKPARPLPQPSLSSSPPPPPPLPHPGGDWFTSMLSFLAIPVTPLLPPPTMDIPQVLLLKPVYGAHTRPAVRIAQPSIVVPVWAIEPIDSTELESPFEPIDLSAELHRIRRSIADRRPHSRTSKSDRQSQSFESISKSSRNEFVDSNFFRRYFLHQDSPKSLHERLFSPANQRRQDQGQVTDRLSIYKINHGVNEDPKKGRYLYFSDGDGFVNIESVLGCLRWFNHPKYKFFFDIKRDSHLGLLRNLESVDYLVDVIMNIR